MRISIILPALNEAEKVAAKAFGSIKGKLTHKDDEDAQKSDEEE